MNTKTMIGVCAFVALNAAPILGVGPAVAPADRWVGFRGSAEMTGLSAGILPAKLELLWSVDTKQGIEATAAIADGVVYQPTMEGKVHAYDLASGARKWTFDDPDGSGCKSSPCVAGDLLIVANDLGTIKGLDRSTGKEVWKRQTDGEIISSPVLLGDRVFVGSYDTCLYCLEARTGAVIWKKETGGPVHGSPTISQGTVAVAGCDGIFRLLRVADGVEVGQHEIGGNLASTPATVKDHYFLGTTDGQVLCIDRQTFARVWSQQANQFAIHSSPALTEGLVIIGSRDKGVHAMDMATGKERWVFKARSRIDSSPVVTGQRVFVGANDGKLYELDLMTGRKLWEFTVQEDVPASPAIAAGRLVIGNSAGVLFCFGAK